MKKSFMSISMLVVSLSMLALFACSSVVKAQASASTFIYDKSEKAETVYTLDKTGKFLTPKVKYEYSKEESGKTVKKAYRWNAVEKKWIPSYLMSIVENDVNTVLEYAVWDSKAETYSLNLQKTVYNKGLENDVISFLFYKWNPENNNWVISQHLLFEDYLAAKTDSME